MKHRLTQAMLHCLITLLLWQILLDDLTALVAHLDDVVAASVLDRLMEGERDGTRGDVEGATGHDLVAAVDTDGDYGQPELKRQFECAVLELTHLARIGAATFRKDNNRHTTVQFLLGCRHGVAQALWGVGIDKDVTCHAAGGTNDWNVGDAFAHHPLEVVTQVTIYGEDVVGSLMIGDEHIARFVVNEFAADDLDSHQVYPAPNPSPPLGREIAPIILVE